MLTFSRNRE